MSVFETPKVEHPCSVTPPEPRLSPNDLTAWEKVFHPLLPKPERSENSLLRSIDEIRYCWALIEAMARTIDDLRREQKVLRNQRWAAIKQEEQARKLVAGKAHEQKITRQRRDQR